MNGEPTPPVEPTRSLAEWLQIAYQPLLELVEAATHPNQILEVAVRLNALSAALEAWEGNVRDTMAKRLEELTGGRPAQG